MGLLDKLKGKSSSANSSPSKSYAPPQGAPPSASNRGSQYGQPAQQAYGQQGYGQPQGGYQQPQAGFAPPAGPPPSAAGLPAGMENQLAALRRYDTVVLVDDSGSMGMYWDQTAAALAGLCKVASQYDDDGIDCYFFNWPTPVLSANNPQMIMRTFDQINPRYRTPTAKALRVITEPYMRKLEAAKASGAKVKPMNLLCLTDGAPDKGEEPDNLIIDIAQRLDRIRAPLSQFGIQFVQIGNDSEAREALEHLDDNLANAGGADGKVRDICDTTLSEPGQNLDSAFLIKALLGAINRKIDNSA